jgi:LPXTG-motif cell wall-anchored protein
MSLTRRVAAGLPAAGVTAFAALAFAGTPAIAATADAANTAVRPVVMTSPCTDVPRSNCSYPAGGASAPPGDVSPTSTTDDNGNGNGNTPHRGHPSYGSVSPSTVPTPTASTPTGNTDTVPPGGGVSPTTVTPGTGTPRGGGVSPASTLPLTGAPMGVTLAFGALLVGAGAGAVWYSRRRRTT